MAFTRHVGKHNDRKVAIIFREIPGEDHMCLAVYTDLVNAQIHDDIIRVIDSDMGQTSDNLADALHRTVGSDGKNILQNLHVQGFMKKIQTSQIMMIPAPNQQIKLDELNKILNEMKNGEEAVKKLADMDASRGLQHPDDVKRRKQEARDLLDNSLKNIPANESTGASTSTSTAAQGAMGDQDLANNLRQQALKMASEAKSLLAESDRLLKQAGGLDPVVAEAPRGRGRPKKALA